MYIYIQYSTYIIGLYYPQQPQAKEKAAAQRRERKQAAKARHGLQPMPPWGFF